MTVSRMLVVIALVLFVLAAFGVPVHDRVALVPLGLACLAGSQLA